MQRNILQRFCTIATLFILLTSVAPAFSAGGINVRKSSGTLVFRRAEDDSTDTIVTTGTTNLRLYEMQDDGSLKSYDWADNTFKTTALTTENVSMVNRAGNNGTTATGLWTYSLATVTGFSIGKTYIAVAENSLATPKRDRVEFQFGSADGDTSLDSTGAANISLTQALPAVPTLRTVGAALFYSDRQLGRLGTAQGGTTTTITLDASASSVDNIYNGHFIVLTGGTGALQTATISGYVGATKVATISRPGAGAWSTTPDATTTFVIIPIAQSTLLAGQNIATVGGLAPPTNWSLTATDGLGRLLLQPSQPGVTIPVVTGVTNPVTIAPNQHVQPNGGF